MITVGIDLAAEPAGTALAVVQWASDRATVTDLRLGIDNSAIVGAAARADKLGIDCALGWPDDFVEFVSSHARLEPLAPTPDEGIDWRRRLAYRATDRDVRGRTGRFPLSVATDRLGLTALRCAVLLRDLADAGVAIDRSGTGLVVEVYPAASLRGWGLSTTGYKQAKDVARRTELVAELRALAPWLVLTDGFVEAMIASADAFDAVIAALATRAAATDRATRPTTDELPQARREGWIALPTCTLAELIQTPRR